MNCPPQAKIYDFDPIWSTFRAIREWLNPLKCQGNIITIARCRRKFWEFTILIQFRALFLHSENVWTLLNVEESKLNYNLIIAAAGENFENLLFLINFGVPFQQSENGRTILMSRKVNRTTTARRRRKFWEFTIFYPIWSTFPANSIRNFLIS